MKSTTRYLTDPISHEPRKGPYDN